MTSILKVDTIQDIDGNNIINESSDTITIGASGDTVNIVGTLQNNGSGLVSGITMADMWRLTANISTSADITTNLERVDEPSSGFIGTGMTESSGIFSFPSTGIYLVLTANRADANNDNLAVITNVSIDSGSTYDTYSEAVCGVGAAGRENVATALNLIDVTNTSTVKIKFTTASVGAGSLIIGNTNLNATHFTFIRLGDT